MTPFLDVRTNPVGGCLAKTVALYQGSDITNYVTISRPQMVALIQGRNVLIGAHGFNVNRADGIQDLDTWGKLLLELNPTFDAFVGLLWPGDSVWLHGLDYPEEPKIADEAGVLLAPFLDDLLSVCSSVSFCSHSLGARVVLRTILNMKMNVRNTILMAGAIDDSCLTSEFQDASKRAGKISVLASKNDEVLALAFPLGNLLSGILDVGHPWWHSALGRSGPQQPWPSNFQAPFEIPDGWQYGHHHYLQTVPLAANVITAKVDVPPQGSSEPSNGAPGWQQVFSAAFVSTRFSD
jgi:hypothetical protein